MRLVFEFYNLFYQPNSDYLSSNDAFLKKDGPIQSVRKTSN